ncbi:hypothetical protein KJ912_02930 [Patescibacteria group bacterium]|nr:hypothetical protein [Patescibacteria group bacterium]
MKPKKTGLKKQKHDFKKSLDELRTIGEWFSDREEVDVEQGLEKAKKGAKLIKICNFHFMH